MEACSCKAVLEYLANVREIFRQFGRGLFDYAGLYPPAALKMDAAIAEFHHQRSLPSQDWVACFVVDAPRLADFLALSPPKSGPVSLLAGTRRPFGADLDLVDALIADIQQIESVAPPDLAGEAGEAGLSVARNIRRQSARFSPRRIFLEIRPGDPALFDVAHALAASNAEHEDRMLALKIRCGGERPGDTPSIDDVSRFLTACAQADVPFKATAGLHHPIRRVTDGGMMHGFMNVFLAAILVRRSTSAAPAAELLPELLSETDASRFSVEDDTIGWRHIRFGLDEVARARAEFALSIGSCSIAEPVADLQSLGWL